MSGIGFWELIILFLIGLIVLGPKRLPQVANQLGEWIGQAKRMTRVMRRQLEELDRTFLVTRPIQSFLDFWLQAALAAAQP